MACRLWALDGMVPRRVLTALGRLYLLEYAYVFFYRCSMNSAAHFADSGNGGGSMTRAHALPPNTSSFHHVGSKILMLDHPKEESMLERRGGPYPRREDDDLKGFIKVRKPEPGSRCDASWSRAASF